jgi:hypothetical protein
MRRLGRAARSPWFRRRWWERPTDAAAMGMSNAPYSPTNDAAHWPMPGQRFSVSLGTRVPLVPWRDGAQNRAPLRPGGQAKANPAVGRLACMYVSRARLSVIAAVSLLAAAILSLAVSRGDSALKMDRSAIHLLGRPPDVDFWQHFADFLAVPVIAAVLIASLVFGARRRILSRVGLFAAIAAVTLVISEHIVKPAVGERFFGQLSFPSGNVTAVCATAAAMWIALYPVLGKWGRGIAFGFGAVWTFLMSVSVVGAIWHTPLDCLGSVLLSLGVVAAGGAVFQPKQAPSPPMPAERLRVMGRV